MSYFLRQDKKKNGIYLQMYESYWDKELKQSRNKSVRAFGYVHELISEEIPDPIAHYKNVVKEFNQKRKDEFSENTRPRAFTSSIEKNVGYFLLDALMDELAVKETIDILASARQFQFRLYDLITQLIYSRVIAPCSKSKTASHIFPMLFNNSAISEDQVYDGCEFIGANYKKYIELFNHYYSKYYKRNYDKVFFDCTNYYFEIDLPDNDRQKGPSKENRHDPIIGQALLLDSDLVPLAMQMYPGNESEKPYIRKIIEEMKQRYHVNGKTIQVADKGLNCARNIYAAVKESNDGYIFSKSVHGRNLSNTEKAWVLLENDANVYTDYFDNDGKLLYRLKSCVDTFSYTFKETDPETGEIKTIKFSVKEKRVVSFNPALAKKKIAEISRMVDKASNCISLKALTKEEIGDSSKYIKITNTDSEGKKVKPVFEIDKTKMEEDIKFAGYNMIVTSESEMEPVEIYNTYHNLWKIEESFRITKSQLDGRPVYVQKKKQSMGIFSYATSVCFFFVFLKLNVLKIESALLI